MLNNNYLIFFTVFLIKILNAQQNIDKNGDVDLDYPKMTGVKAKDEFSYTASSTLKWPLGIIPYYIDSEVYDSIISQRIRSAMNTIQSASCVVFKSMNNVPIRSNGSWLHFTNPSQERECVHGPLFGDDGEVKIVLGFDCMRRQDVLHSVLHALGFRDEVSHPQRDQYIRILWQNLQPKYRTLYRIKFDGDRTKTLVEYDPMSVMHFHDRAFSSNGRATIAPLVPGLIISPSENLSQLDKMKLRLYFGHECNKRKVGDILDTCKNVLRETSSTPKQHVSHREVESEVGFSKENEKMAEDKIENKNKDPASQDDGSSDKE